jgi:RNA-dependent RNA polymerase
MERDEKKSYTSTSVLGKIYDEVTSKESEIDPEISKLLIYIGLIPLVPLTVEKVIDYNILCFFSFSFYYSEIVPLSCFTEVEVSDYYKRRWKALYYEYLGESTNFCKLEDKEEKKEQFPTTLPRVQAGQ